MMKKKKNKQCPICGCTEHRLIGCATHWRNHFKNEEGRCEIGKSEEKSTRDEN
jgi:hypothetical protein